MNRIVVSFLLLLLLIGCSPLTEIQTQVIQATGSGPTEKLVSQTTFPISPTPSQTLTPSPAPILFNFPSFPTDLVIDTLPMKCPEIGYQSYSEPSVPPAFTLQVHELPVSDLDHGIPIIVATNSDEVNGDTNCLDCLKENPGKDGISLREALLVSNFDPGEYTILFDPKLKGATIQVGACDHTELPPLDGGSVIISGDIDGDQEPDITVANEVAELNEDNAIFGFRVHSSNNTIYALRITGFTIGVFFDAPSTKQVYSDNTFSHLEIEGESGFGLYSARVGENEPIDMSNNTWKNIWIIDNIIHAKSGIWFLLHRASGDMVENLTIQNNQIFIQSNEDTGGRGIDISPGWGSDSENNRFKMVVIRNNAIEGNPEIAIGIGNGAGDSKNNIIENVLIQKNQISMSGNGKAIDVAAGHGLESHGNTIQNVRIIGNHIQGSPSVGIDLLSGFGGSGGNVIRQVEISNNVLILSHLHVLHSFGIDLTAGFWVNTTGNSISDVIVTNNYIEGNSESSFFVSSGAVGSSMNRVERIRFSHNEIKLIQPTEYEGPQHGIAITTGDGATVYDDPDYRPIVYPNGNIINEIWISGNHVTGNSSGHQIIISTGDPGVRDNTIQKIYILGNQLNGVLFEMGILDSTISLEHGGEDGNIIQEIYIQQNNLVHSNSRDQFFGEEVVSGGIVLSAGNGATMNTTQDIWIIANEISSQAPGINLVAGWAQPEFPPSIGNTISGVRIWCNSIAENPIMLEQYFPGIKGINLVGGWGKAQDNRVEYVYIEDNLVAGVDDEFSIFENIGENSQGNSVNLP